MIDANIFPQLCRETGLTCEACTEHTALNLARVCQGLPRTAVGQMFVQLYPQTACSPMYAHFAAAYREASSEGDVAGPRLVFSVA